MKLRKSIDFRKIAYVLYSFCFAVYLIIGLKPVAQATNYEISGNLIIPSIGLSSVVTTLRLNDHKLDTPDTIVGSFTKNNNNTLLIGHASTVFYNLDKISLGDEINYETKSYTVIGVEVLSKNEIEMNSLLKAEAQPTIILMTCAGENLGGGDATHRLIVKAQAL